jgi:hypothetical protein
MAMVKSVASEDIEGPSGHIVSVVVSLGNLNSNLRPWIVKSTDQQRREKYETGV